jgi:ABC-type phosphate transport system substrate-binding protein
MLTRPGQEAVQLDGKWIPIPAETSRAGIAKLDAPGKIVWPAESVFERKVFEGGNMWNDSVKECPLMLKADGTRTVPSADRVKRVAMDANAFTFSSEGFGTGQTKALPLAATAEGPLVPLTLENVRSRSYPLTLELYAYADQQPDKPMDPVTKEFLRFLLSRGGREILQRDGKWLT